MQIIPGIFPEKVITAVIGKIVTNRTLREVSSQQKNTGQEIKQEWVQAIPTKKA
jgi:hypothetical protein